MVTGVLALTLWHEEFAGVAVGCTAEEVQKNINVGYYVVVGEGEDTSSAFGMASSRTGISPCFLFLSCLFFPFLSFFAFFSFLSFPFLALLFFVPFFQLTCVCRAYA